MQDLISIIVPVYNVERYVARCVDSLIEQTYSNIEIILVDDGSTDGSGRICDEYAACDSRVRVIHKENGGVSTARNAGIAAAGGKWIWFVDADDWIDKDSVRIALENAGGDFIIFGARRVYEGANQEVLTNSDNNVVSEEKSADEILTGGEFYVWAYWFLRDKIIENQILFAEGFKYSEDIDFTFRYLSYCESGQKINFALYNYYQRSDSAMRTIDRQNYIRSLKNTIQTLCNCISRDSHKYAFDYHLGTYIRMHLFNLFLYGKSYREIKTELNRLKREEIYPYKKRKENVRQGRNNKERFTRFMYKVCRRKTAYLFFCRVRTLFKKVK